MIRPALAALACVLTGCATYTGESFADFSEPVSDQALVYVYSGETGCVDLGQMNAGILIDQEKRFTLREGSFAELVLAPGTYAFDASTDDQKACHGKWNPGKVWPTVSLELEAGDVHYLQYNPANPSCIRTCDRHLVEVSEVTARADMAGTRQLTLKP